LLSASISREVTVVTGLSGSKTVEAIIGLDFSHVVMIPDAETRLLFDALLAHPQVQVVSPAREGEGVAIAAGLWVGGARPLLVMQNTGLMEAGDSIRGCGLGPEIPLRMLVGWRGYPGAMAGSLPIDSAFTYTEPILRAWGIPYRLLMEEGDLGAIAEMDRIAEETSMPAVAVFGWAFRR
jgi:sulfopyruvate decarboxylase TPP-binding subunit